MSYLGFSKEQIDAIDVFLRYDTATDEYEGISRWGHTICDEARQYWRRDLEQADVRISANALMGFRAHVNNGSTGIAWWIRDNLKEAQLRKSGYSDSPTVSIHKINGWLEQCATLPWSAKKRPFKWTELARWLKATLIWLFEPEAARKLMMG